MIAATDDRAGRRIARLFRKMRELPRDIRACDLGEILAADSIDIQESWCPDPGYTACLVNLGDGIPAGILLARGQTRGRKRFSIAHELGHLYIPTHANRPDGWCSESAMIANDGVGDQMEWEANDFAAELLMPQHLFAKDAARLVPSFASVTLFAGADQYDVSITAAAIRYTEMTRFACALASSREGVIEWVIKSESFGYRIPWRGDRVPASSVAASGAAVLEPQGLAPEVWLEIAQRRPVEVFESTHRIPSQQQTLSLVWVEEEGEWE
jgi:hypothetical protein